MIELMKELRRTLLTERLTEVAISPPQVCKETPSSRILR